MNSFRTLLSLIVVGLLACGYAGSQVAAINSLRVEQADAATKYAAQIDSPPIKWLALVILIGSIGLSFVRDKEASDK